MPRAPHCTLTSSHLGYGHKDSVAMEIHVLRFLVDVNSGDTNHASTVAPMCQLERATCTAPEPLPAVVPPPAPDPGCPTMPCCRAGARPLKVPSTAIFPLLLLSAPVNSSPASGDPSPGQHQGQGQEDLP